MVVLILFLWGSTSDDRGQAKKISDMNRRVHRFKGSGNVDAAFMDKI